MNLVEFNPKKPNGQARIRAPKPGAAGGLGLVTEDSAALRFAALYGGKLHFDHDAGSWRQWDGTRWRENRTGLAFHHARELAREIAERESDKTRTVTSKTSFASGVERFARADPVFAVTSEGWDADPWALGTPAGTVDLRTGRQRPPNPAERITKQTSIAPADTADCPLWLAFLDETFGGDAEMVRFLAQWAGYSLTGDISEHALVFGHGGGGNGKSVAVNTLTGIAGDYAATAAMDTFAASQNDRHPADLAMLRGARMVTASETEEGRAWAEARIKALTGGDPITARFMRENFFTFRPSFKLFVVGNHKPAIRVLDDAMRRRFNILPFTRKPERPDPALETKLRGEWPAILRWAINGALDWQANGLLRPAAVREATADYFAGQDTFATWLAEACDVDPANSYKTERASDLFASWKDFATAAVEKPGSLNNFSDRLLARGFTKKHTRAGAIYQGVRLRPAQGYDRHV